MRSKRRAQAKNRNICAVALARSGAGGKIGAKQQMGGGLEVVFRLGGTERFLGGVRSSFGPYWQFIVKRPCVRLVGCGHHELGDRSVGIRILESFRYFAFVVAARENCRGGGSSGNEPSARSGWHRRWKKGSPPDSCDELGPSPQRAKTKNEIMKELVRRAKRFGG